MTELNRILRNPRFLQGGLPCKWTDTSPGAIYTELATRTSVADSGLGGLDKGGGGAGRAKVHAAGDSSSVKDAEESRITYTEVLASRSGCSVGVGLPGRHAEQPTELDSISVYYRAAPARTLQLPGLACAPAARMRTAPPHPAFRIPFRILWPFETRPLHEPGRA